MILGQEAAQSGEMIGLVLVGGVIAGLGYTVWRTKQRATKDYYERKRRQAAEEAERKRRMRGE